MIGQNLKGVPQTLLIPLWARAEESKRKDAIIKDDLALKMISQIDFDFSKFEKEWATQLYVAIRTEILDKAARRFIEAYPNAVVINLGCGLDTRFFRVDNGKIAWYDLDLPEPISIKKKFFEESDRYRMIARSVLDYSWIGDIEINDRPVLIIAEGLLMYFKEEEVKEIISNLVKAFPKAEMLFEMVPPALVKASGQNTQKERFGMAAVFQWGIASGKEMENYSPNIKFIEEWNYLNYHKSRWNLVRLFALIPAYKNNFCNRIVHVAFNP